MVVGLVLVALVAVACSSDDGGDDGAGDDDDDADDGGDDAAADGDVGIALIVKNTSNPFFVSMRDSAQAAADDLGVSLTFAAGVEDGDTESQIRAIEERALGQLFEIFIVVFLIHFKEGHKD